jgi:predicted Zn-dependent protease
MRAAGYSGNKNKGIQELKLTAEHGRFLAPFARILLAIAYLREHDVTQARALLLGLREDFPSNPLFAREIGRIDSLRN